jgi:hypothetical protein
MQYGEGIISKTAKRVEARAPTRASSRLFSSVCVRFSAFRVFCGLLLLSFFFAACSKHTVNPRLDSEMPKKVLWAWERPEDLRFANPNEFGIAFLAQTLVLQGDEITYRPRRQPLEIAQGAYVIAVTRIETIKEGGKRPSFSDNQRLRIVSLIKSTLERPNVRAIQIDFDAVASERKFYRAIMNDLRPALPENMPLTMTSLASWCVGDAWFNDFLVDEAVPMAFEMGADDETIKNFLREGNDWREPLCRGSYGISVDDPLGTGLKKGRRVYYFKNSAWSSADLNRLK